MLIRKNGIRLILYSFIMIYYLVRPGMGWANDSVLWYTQAARQWEEALPVGNGRLGAMVFGGIEQDHLQLNEDTMWSGSPVDIDRIGSYITDYRRELDLNSAIVRVIYRNGDATFVREIFCSTPHQVLVVRVTSDKLNRVSLKVNMDRPEFAEVIPIAPNLLIMKGRADRGRQTEGVKFAAHLQVIAEDGDVRPSEAGLLIENANAVTLKCYCNLIL